MLVAVHQNALLERDLSIAASQAATWSVSVIDFVDRDQLGTAREHLAQLVDPFISTYLAVNPKPERSRHEGPIPYRDPPPCARATFSDGTKHPTARIYSAWTSEGIIGLLAMMESALFQPGWFVEELLSQTLIVHMIRTSKIPSIQRAAVLTVALLTATIMAIGRYVPFSPWGSAVCLVPLPMSYFPWHVATLLSYCVPTQLVKG